MKEEGEALSLSLSRFHFLMAEICAGARTIMYFGNVSMASVAACCAQKIKLWWLGEEMISGVSYFLLTFLFGYKGKSS